jgi:hypothetical protein
MPVLAAHRAVNPILCSFAINAEPLHVRLYSDLDQLRRCNGFKIEPSLPRTVFFHLKSSVSFGPYIAVNSRNSATVMGTPSGFGFARVTM